MSHAQLPCPSGPYLRTDEPEAALARPPLTSDQLIELGRLLYEKRKAAGLSRTQLGRAAALSDCTIKFIEKARHAPRTETLRRLMAVAALKFSWHDLPGHPRNPIPLMIWRNLMLALSLALLRGARRFGDGR